jgi:hypothetical protein
MRRSGLIGALLGASLLCPAAARAQGVATTMTDLARIRGGARWPPTLHGTGTEDYFNTAWSPSPDEPFFTPFYGIARVDGETGWLGRTHLYRFHIPDPIYFDKSLEFSIEHGHDNNLTLDLASVAYWYQTEPHKPFPPFPSRAQRRPMPLINAVDIHRWRDAWRKAMGNDPRLWGDEQKKSPEQ